MATAVTAWASSQSRSSRSSAVVVPKVRTSCPCPPPAPGARTHAVTLFLCTSSPQLRSTMRSIAALLWPCCRPEEGPHHDFARRARWQQFRVPAPPASVSASDSCTTDTRRRPSGSAPFSSPRADFVHARFCVQAKRRTRVSWLEREPTGNATQRGLGRRQAPRRARFNDASRAPHLPVRHFLHRVAGSEQVTLDRVDVVPPRGLQRDLHLDQASPARCRLHGGGSAAPVGAGLAMRR